MPFFKRVVCYWLLLACAFFASAWQAVSADTQEASAQPRPRVGLVLSGGGARGTAHIGVLKVLEEMRIAVDYIAGTSMGAIIGGLYASGLAPEEIEAKLSDIDWNYAFRDEPPREQLSFRRKQDDLSHLIQLDLGLRRDKVVMRKGLRNGQKLSMLLRGLSLHTSSITDFNQLPIAFNAVATDVETGNMIVLDRGQLATAMHASMAVPGVFAPVEIDGHQLIDGGVTNNLPVDVARMMGADIVIAVDAGSHLVSADALESVLDVSTQMVVIVTRSNTSDQIATLTAQDILLQPRFAGINWAEFERSGEAIAAGINAARDQASKLASYSLTETDYQAYLRHQRRQPLDSIRVNSLRLENDSRVADAAIAGRLSIHPGDALTPDDLEENFGRVYGMGDFEHVDYRLIPRTDNTTELVLKTRGKAWGPTYMRAGLNLEDTFDGDTNVNLLFDITRTRINQLGAEWKNQIRIGDAQHLASEFYQPLDYSGFFFLAPRIETRRDIVDRFEEDYRVSQYKVRLWRFALDAGVQIGPNWGEARMGVILDQLSATPRIGPVDAPEYDVQQGAYNLNLVFDQLDSPGFPRSGSYGQLGLTLVRAGLGADISYDKFTLAYTRVSSHKAHTLTASVLVQSSLDTEMPVFDRYTLGGFLNLSGYARGQLSGQHAGLAELVYYKAFTRMPRGLGEGVYIGGSLETGNAWQQKNEIRFDNLNWAGSIFLGADTLLGPLYLAYGYAENSRGAAYLVLGQTF